MFKVQKKHIIFILSLLLVITYIIIQSFKKGDFNTFLNAAMLLREGQNCYNVWINGGAYSYSPFFAILLIPLTFLNAPFPQLIWLAFDVFLLFRLWKIINFYLDTNKLILKNKIIWNIVVTALILRFTLHNFELIQMTIFLVYCTIESLYLIYLKKPIAGALILSLGIISKILPIVILPYLLYRKEFKAFIGVLVFVFIFVFFPVIIYGWEFNTVLLTDWWKVINPSNIEFTIEQNKFGEGVLGLSGFIPALFQYSNTEYNVPFIRTICQIDGAYIVQILNALRLILILFTIYFLRTLPFVKNTKKLHFFWEISYICAITPLIFPHQRKYEFFFLYPAISYVIYFLLYNSQNKLKGLLLGKHRFIIVLLIIFFLLTTITTDGIIGDYLNYLSDYYKTITIGTFLLIIILSMCKPDLLSDDS